MELRNQVCTPEQSQNLKELGIVQKSLFYYHRQFDRPVFGETLVSIPVAQTEGPTHSSDSRILVCNDKQNAISAFTVAELEEALPCDLVVSKIKGPGPTTLQIERHYRCGYHGIISIAGNAAILRAKILIYLLENNLTTAAEVNARLTA